MLQLIFIYRHIYSLYFAQGTPKRKIVKVPQDNNVGS